MQQYLLLFILCLVGAHCAVSSVNTHVSDAERAKGFSCKSYKLGLMKAGETRVNHIPNFCVQLRCRANGEIISFTCGTVAGPPECKIVKDLTRPYPDCCPQIIC